MGDFASGLAAGTQWRLANDARDEKEKNDARKFKAMVEYADASGLIPKNRAITMDVDSLEGALQGMAAKSGLDRAKQQEEKANVEMNAQYLDMLSKAAALNDQNRSRAADVDFQTRLLAMPGQSEVGGVQAPGLDPVEMFRQRVASGAPPDRAAAMSQNLAQILTMMKRTDQPVLGFGEVREVPGAGKFVGTGGEPKFIEAQTPALALGEERPLPSGGRLVGVGTGAPHFVADTDKTKALTEQQANALQFSDRMAYNDAILTGLEQNGFHPAAVGTTLKNLGPNLTQSSEFQQYDAAKKNWISAVLRKESGAAISKSEESGAEAQYFPRMGDSPAVIKQKAQLRKLAEVNMRRAIGEIKDGKPAPVSSVPARFDSEVAARTAGAKAGDIIELYDPTTATYRKARLK